MSTNLTSFTSGCGVVNQCTDYYKQPQQGGNGNYSNDGLIPLSNGKNYYKETDFSIDSNKLLTDNYGIDYSTSFGGVKKKKKPAKKILKKPAKKILKKPAKKSSKKGGFSPLDGEEVDFSNTFAPIDDVMKGGLKCKKTCKKTGKKIGKKTGKKQSGGMESSGATGMDLRFFDKDAPLYDYSELSGNGSSSAYGSIKVGDVGTGILAPFTASHSNSAYHASDMKTGGKKTLLKSKSKKTHKAKAKKSKKSKKSMKGGAESEGATGLPQRFFNSESFDSSKVIGNDLSTSNLAPYISGGKKRTNKRGGGPIPTISDKPITTVQGTINGAIDGFSKFMQKLDADYLKSVDYVKSIKIGNTRLIKGGLKKEKKDKKGKKVVKKRSKSLKGGDGSDWAVSQGSRGPVNAPDDYWGVPGEQWFRQFNKTGDYIPNSKLPVSATPLLAGKGDSNVVSGYDEFGRDYGKA